jgi:hypothetical protein
MSLMVSIYTETINSHNTFQIPSQFDSQGHSITYARKGLHKSSTDKWDEVPRRSIIVVRQES